MNIQVKAWLGLICLIVAMGLLIFVCAGTTDYPEAWVFLAVYLAGSLLLTLYLIKYDPSLLRRRMRGGPFAEPEPAQRIIMTFASIGFVGALVLPAFDHRWRWSSVSPVVVTAGNLLIVLWFGIVFFVFRENTFTSATVEVSRQQKVISTGPYAIVRHPMYAAGLLLFLGTPLALGSYWGLLAVVVAAPALIWRLLHEEKLLARNLPGYAEYCARVRWRLVPGLF
jgi:protein-S-isoprenylcysteine O-methyltransferase Ste14